MATTVTVNNNITQFRSGSAANTRTDNILTRTDNILNGLPKRFAQHHANTEWIKRFELSGQLKDIDSVTTTNTARASNTTGGFFSQPNRSPQAQAQAPAQAPAQANNTLTR